MELEKNVYFNPDVWGEHYWFFLHTVAYSYPLTPNEVTKKKYYELIHSLPLFIPVEEIGNSFSNLLDKYPVTPYLDCRESFVTWMNFIHNKVNVLLGKKEVDLEESMREYFARYKPKYISIRESIRSYKKYIYTLIIVLLLIIVGVFYGK